MADEGDPAFIVNLMDPSTDHNVYFLVGDQSCGNVERIGVVMQMLMAHSMVLRRSLSVQEKDLSIYWDIALPNITPRTFRNMLKYTYGFNNIETHELPEAVRLLGVADRLMMHSMMWEVSKHIINILTPSNVCLALTNPLCLTHKRLREKIAQTIQSSPAVVLESPHLPEVSPAGMRYLVQLDSLPVSLAVVWQAVVNWARRKVLKEEYPAGTSQLASHIRPKLLVPSLKHLRICAMRIINYVEPFISGTPPSEDNLRFLRHYHLVSPRGLYVCTGCEVSRITKQTHEWFELKVIHNSSSWTDALLRTRSELIINTFDSCIQLYSVVCTAVRKVTEEPSNATVIKGVKDLDSYECQCTVKTSMFSKEEEPSTVIFKSNGQDPEEQKVSSETLCNETETIFKDLVLFEQEFEMCLNPNCEMLILQPHSTYKIEPVFKSPHPLWFNNDIDCFHPSGRNYFNVGGGLVSRKNFWYGSHIKYVLYRPLSLPGRSLTARVM